MGRTRCLIRCHPFRSYRSTAQEIAELQKYLDKEISPKRDGSRNLLIATWNLKEFGSLTDRWLARATDQPKRDYRALWAITEIVSRFDIVALQEVGGDLKALRTMLKTLGEDWHFLITDRTKGDAGGGEGSPSSSTSRRVTLSGLACELVVPDDLLKPGEDEPCLSRQFARTPYAVGFRAGGETVILVTLHICYGTNLDTRRDELHAIARWMADWARETTLFEQNLIALGDFNIDRQGSPLYDAFVHSGLSIPKDLENVERSIFAKDAKRLDKYYDQIAGSRMAASGSSSCATSREGRSSSLTIYIGTSA